MADAKNEMPAGGGSYARDPRTGKLKLLEEPTVQEPGAANSVPVPAEAATPVEEKAPAPPARKAEET